MSSKLSNLQFTYTDPTPNFDRRDVKGLVAELIEISEQNFDASTALEVAAGGRLYNVFFLFLFLFSSSFFILFLFSNYINEHLFYCS